MRRAGLHLVARRLLDRHERRGAGADGQRGCTIDPSVDVNETAAIVYDAKRSGGKSAVLILGGGSPKNFVLQTEPQIQEVLGIAEKGHDYFLAVTDARPDTGGLSGATPAEAVSWGKIDPDQLPGHGGLLHRLDHRAAAADRLRARQARAAPAQAALRPPRADARGCGTLSGRTHLAVRGSEGKVTDERLRPLPGLPGRPGRGKTEPAGPSRHPADPVRPDDLVPAGRAPRADRDPRGLDPPRDVRRGARCRETWEEVGIETLAAVVPDTAGPAATMERIERVAHEVVASGRFLVGLGGEHSVTAPLVRAVRRSTATSASCSSTPTRDLRDSFEGSPHNHACVMHRVIDDGVPIAQVGIRSLTGEERELIRELGICTVFAPEAVAGAVGELDRPRALRAARGGLRHGRPGRARPAIMPATGTPEPGGLDWYRALAVLRAVARRKRVVGFDVVELAPIPGNVAPDFLAAKLVYRLLGYAFLLERSGR